MLLPTPFINSTKLTSLLHKKMQKLFKSSKLIIKTQTRTIECTFFMIEGSDIKI